MDKLTGQEVTISFEENNEELRKKGYEPYPFKSITFQARSEKHLELIVKSYKEFVHRWWIEQAFELKKI